MAGVNKIDHSLVCKMYEEDRLSSTEIALKLGISGTQVLRILKANEIKTRGRSENKKLALNKPETRKKMSVSATGRRLKESSKNKLRLITGSKNANWRAGLSMTAGGYLQFTASPANGEHAQKLVHNIIAEWKFGRMVEKGEHVHHIDGNKLNNAPENLIIMSASDHAKLHTEDRENGKRIKSV